MGLQHSDDDSVPAVKYTAVHERRASELQPHQESSEGQSQTAGRRPTSVGSLFKASRVGSQRPPLSGHATSSVADDLSQKNLEDSKGLLVALQGSFSSAAVTVAVCGRLQRPQVLLLRYTCNSRIL